MGGSEARDARLGAYNERPCGRGSVVEHHLAKVRVASSNLVARSKKTPWSQGVFSFRGVTRNSRPSGFRPHSVPVRCA
jgi:hypothetical protein